MTISSAQKQSLPASMFYLWRSLLLLAWTDGECGREETAYFAKVFDNLARYYNLTQEQKDTLADDLVAPQNRDILDFLSYINDPDTRRVLYVFAYDLALLDGILHPAEKEILDKLHISAPAAMTQEEIRNVVAELEDKAEQERQELRKHIRGMRPFYAALDTLLMRLGIDLIK
jgi:hypothetical protein